MNSKIATSFKSEFQKLVSYSDNRYASITTSGDEYENDMLVYAFFKVLGPVPGIIYGHSMAEYKDKALELFKLGSNNNRGFYYELSTAYDWLYNDLSPADRTMAVNVLKTMYNPSSGETTADPFHGTRSSPRAYSIIAGLAYYGDADDDGSAQNRLDNFGWSMVGPGGSLETLSWLAGDDGGYSSGMGYAANGKSGMFALLFGTEAWRTANGLSKAAIYLDPRYSVIRYYPKFLTNLILPYPTRGIYHMLKDNFSNAGADPGQAYAGGTIAMLRLFQGVDNEVSSLAGWLVENRTGAILNDGGVLTNRFALFANFIFNEPGVIPKSPDMLNFPLSWFQDGYGRILSRTGWGDSDSLVQFVAARWQRCCSTYFSANQGNFTIDRYGPLIITAGTGAHHAYNDNTWGSNLIIFTDPNEPVNGWPQYWDEGGQRTLYPELGTPLTQWTAGSQWDMGGIKRREDATGGRDYEYAFADITRAYNGPANFETWNTQKVKNFTRQFIYFKPQSVNESDRLIIYDRTETIDTKFEKRWLLHPAGNSTISVNGAESLVRDGKWSYGAANQVTITNRTDGAHGRVFSTTLLPANHEMIKIGGPGHQFETPYGVNDTDSSYGVDYYDYIGTHTMQVISKNVTPKESFLHVMEAVDANVVSNPSPTVKIDGTTMVGARIGNRAVMFDKDEGYVLISSFNFDLAGSYKLLLADLQPSRNYTITIGGVPMSKSASTEGTIYVDANVAGNLSVSIAAQ